MLNKKSLQNNIQNTGMVVEIIFINHSFVFTLSRKYFKLLYVMK